MDRVLHAPILARIPLPEPNVSRLSACRPTSDAMQVHEALQLFQLQLRANGRSVHTQQQYARHVRMLDAWVATTNRSRDLRDIDHVVISEFLCSPTVVEKRGGGRRRATSANGLRSSLRSFFGWAHAAGYAQRNAAALVKRARCSPSMGRVLTDDEVSRLEQTLAAATGPEAERDRVMFGLAVACGLRVSSLVSLCAEDISGGEVHVRRAKNDASLRLFVPRSFRPALERYISGRSGPLFTGVGGRPLTSRHAARLLRHWCERAGVRRCSPHALRRTCGTRLYAASHDPFVVQRGLGHRSLASSLPYVAGVEERLRAVLQA